nr:thioredoxin family protein [Butyrivibrio sp.]
TLHCQGHYPATGLFLANGTYSGISFLGIPGGKEINSFLLGIYNLAGPGQTIEPDILRKISLINTPKDISVLVSLSCHHCADTVIAAMRLASLNPLISAQMIDARLFPDLIDRYHLERVPVILINEESTAIGGKNISEMLELLT